ncbi:cytidyltransferase-like domain-containing protein [Lacrimispora sphenoides]|uniref:adenylyltransferase/cytidyltransferase family protein n=1 Tax=Lacrimispora sphenoides TaxID=29370 RepID=UPI0008B52B92|nr:adenylyltransferase/cytidyltransferase family protein [Lacrimispora sphenoides]SET95057.1 cytidyltransferase-like domain-containing protein [Lacrimispora sphenoides]
MEVDKIIWDMPKGLLNWYDFRMEGEVLCIEDRESSIKELLLEKCKKVICVDRTAALNKEFLTQYREAFDYIVAIGMAERLTNPVQAFSAWRGLLKSKGRLLLGMDNRLGLRYFCGDRDPFTNRSFDGIENYRTLFKGDSNNLTGRNYSKEEICSILDSSGWSNRKFYSVLPNLDLPQLVYSEDYLPVEELDIRLFPMYRYPDSVFLEEEYLYKSITKNGMFHMMANSFLIECSKDNTFENVDHVTVSMDRGRENAMATIIRDNHTVEKRALYEEGKHKLREIKENEMDLRNHGLNVLVGECHHNSYHMPYVESETAVSYLRRLARENLELFKEEIEKFREFILQSSEHVETEDSKKELGILLRRGYMDLLPLNCFYNNGKYVFYDQEFYEENYPANVIILRMIETIYTGDLEIESIIPRKYFLKKYGLEEKMALWYRMSWEFMTKLRNQRELRSFNEKFQRNKDVVHTNRQRINYSAPEYQKVFVDIFRNAEKKKLILFGSGNFTKSFLAQFKNQYEIYAIVDNDQSKWGSRLEGIEIQSPHIIEEIPKEESRIIICIKNYVAIVHQLQQMGVSDYCIYDTNSEIPRKQEVMPVTVKDMDSLPKKYHTGYIAGVFDLFHIGHLNMFKRAKEQCEYLIVGVVTDEGVRNYKKADPYIPFHERIELVRSCKYVDKAVEIPIHYSGTRNAYKMYHFDCQFSGSDYIDNPDWLGEKTFLEKQGADLVFFPYTEETSSTKIKKLIEKSLL